jgi:hypothetical protein
MGAVNLKVRGASSEVSLSLRERWMRQICLATAPVTGQEHSSVHANHASGRGSITGVPSVSRERA